MPFDKSIPYNDLPDLPPVGDIETTPMLRLLTAAARHLGELNGLCASLPDPALLINTIVLQESKDSSAIENIVTTQDELYMATTEEKATNHAAKEVLNYREALFTGLQKMQLQKNLLLTNTFVDIVQTIKQNQAGLRSTPGTVLKNSISDETIFTPPFGEDIIRKKLKALEHFINDPNTSTLDPLIKMALIHYQFECIHPFSDGNGRTGRILNGLYLVQQSLLSQPVLYLSAYIVAYKAEYYRLLRAVTEKNEWQNWVMFMLTAVSETALMTTKKIRNMLLLKEEMEIAVKKLLGSSYNHDFFQLMFTLPYLKIELIERKGIAHRQTATGWLKKMVDADLLRTQKISRTVYYINYQLMDMLVKPL